MSIFKYILLCSQVSLVNQDDALFRQLLALNTSIHQLRSQSLQRRTRTLSGSRSRGQSSGDRLSPSPSLASLTSLSDGEDEAEGDEASPPPSALVPPPGPLTRKRVSYPPKSRNNTSQLSRNSFNSSVSSASSSSSSSSSAVSSFSGSPAWSTSSGESATAANRAVAAASAVNKTPRSPHSSFYARVKTHNRHPLIVHSGGDLLAVIQHKRQGSYDSGIQGSEPSDAEVFV